jgi:hypothetical protein
MYRWIAGFTLLFCSSMPALATRIIVGMNTVDVQNMNQPQQDALLDQLQRSGVKTKTIRLGLDPKLTAFLIRAHQRDVRKRIKGRKRHILVDTLGLPITSVLPQPEI